MTIQFSEIITTVTQLREVMGYPSHRVTDIAIPKLDKLMGIILIPVGVFFHELGHAFATLQVGGEVGEFQWRFGHFRFNA